MCEKNGVMKFNRVFELEGVHNFRDFGGYPVAGGGRLKRGLLWRSGQHHGASDADLVKIAELGLVDIFDLRSSKEREIHPCRRPPGSAAIVHIGGDPAGIAAPHLAAAATTRQRDAASTREAMQRNYGAIAFRPELIAMTRRYLGVLAQGRGPSLVNCMAGKDRTGFAVAMIHHALGVHYDDIVADYLLTNTAGNPGERIAAGLRSISSLVGDIEPEALRVLMSVEPEYLTTAWQAMRENHGSVDAYQADVLGVDDALRNRLRAALIEG